MKPETETPASSRTKTPEDGKGRGPFASVIDDAERLCRENGCDFWHAVAFHARHGWVIVSPECVLLVERSAWNIAFVWMAIGHNYLGKFCRLAPPEIELVVWERPFKSIDAAPKLRQFPLRRIRALVDVQESAQSRRSAPARSSRDAE